MQRRNERTELYARQSGGRKYDKRSTRRAYSYSYVRYESATWAST